MGSNWVFKNRKTATDQIMRFASEPFDALLPSNHPISSLQRTLKHDSSLQGASKAPSKPRSTPNSSTAHRTPNTPAKMDNNSALHTVLQPKTFELNSLPESWLLRFAELLPSHLKLQLRQCSTQMLGLVDGSSKLRWRVPGKGSTEEHYPALILCKAHIVTIELQELPNAGEPHSAGGLAYWVSRCLRDHIPLARLEQLECRADQMHCAHTLLDAAPQGCLKRLTLWCCRGCACKQDAFLDLDYCLTVSARLPHLAGRGGARALCQLPIYIMAA